MGLLDAVKNSLGLLDARDRRKFLLATLIQAATSFLDLVGVLLLGLLGALAVASEQSTAPPASVQNALEATGRLGWTSQQLLLVLAISAAVVLLLKSVLAPLLLRKVFRFLASRQGSVSLRLAHLLLARPLTSLQDRSRQEVAYSLVQGVSAATLVILGQAVVLFSELSMLLVLAVALTFLDPLIALACVLYFAIVAVVLHYGLGNWSGRSGRNLATLDVASLDLVQTALGTYREIAVLNRREWFANQFGALRMRGARASADLQLIYTLPKYVFEAALVVGAGLLAIALLTTEDSSQAVGTLVLFLAAGTRVMPSILRIQSAGLAARSAAGIATEAIALAKELEGLGSPVGRSGAKTDPVASGPTPTDFTPTIMVDHVSFYYPGVQSPAVKDLSLWVDAGSSLAVVGRSGAGKSTLADLILGLLAPSAGVVLLGGEDASKAPMRWPGLISYVPQDVVLASGSLRQNVALGLEPSSVDDDLVWGALQQAGLGESLQRGDLDLETQVGERGMRLSGGQRQRVGIARALYAQPRLLVMDEATSALDAATERSVSDTIRALEGGVTLVVIAHRLSTVQSANQVLYMEAGTAVTIGTFSEVRSLVPDFDEQSALRGLQ